jgi:hypothetical protein
MIGNRTAMAVNRPFRPEPPEFGSFWSAWVSIAFFLRFFAMQPSLLRRIPLVKEKARRI